MTMMFGHKPANIANLDPLKTPSEQSIHDNRGWYIFQGLVFVCLGFLSAVLPIMTALSADLIVGSLILISGVLQLASSVKCRMHWWSFFSALLSIIVGTAMLWMPLAGLLALAMLIAVFLGIEGFFKTLLALELRPARNWGWMMVSGLAALLLAGLLWSGFPKLSALYLGWIIAVNFVFYGLSVLVLTVTVPR